MKTLIALSFSLLFSHTSFAMESFKFTTPRGAELEVMIHASAKPNSPTIIVAPGQSCNSKGPLFEEMGIAGAKADFTIVRFEWAYCLTSTPNPSPNLINEIEDYQAVMAYAVTLPQVDPTRLVLAGKSLGSLVAYAVFRQTPSARALSLLTPVCSYTTDEEGRRLPEPQRVCEENYPGLKLDPRPVHMAMGDKDDLCILHVLFDYLKDSQGNIHVQVAGGDHGFRLRKTDGSLDNERTQRNIQIVVQGFLNWADLKLNP